MRYWPRQSRAVDLWKQGFVLLLALWPAVAAGHGGGTPQLTDVAAGPYRVFVWTSPEPWQVGEAHTTVAVVKPLADGREEPIDDAVVTVVYTLVDDPDQMIRSAATSTGGATVGFYEADADLRTAGDWRITIEVEGPEGGGEASFVYAVTPSNRMNWWLIGGAALAALVLVGFLGTRRGPRQPAAGQ